MKPIVYLLCGLPGSGKTVWAKKLERRGVIRLSVDELVFERHGRYGIDFPTPEWPLYERQARAELDLRLRELVAGGKSVVLDYGLWTKAQRDEAKALAELLGADWRLVYFAAEQDLLRKRLEQRNLRAAANAVEIDKYALADFSSRFEPPAGEGEETIAQS